jgi:hypothetical protein
MFAFAATHASPHFGVHPGPTTSTGRVLNAASPFGVTDTQGAHVVPVRVERVSNTRRTAPVYDITVAGVHEFFANGVLVHNCMDSLRYALHSYFSAPGVRRDLSAL